MSCAWHGVHGVICILRHGKVQCAMLYVQCDSGAAVSMLDVLCAKFMCEIILTRLQGNPRFFCTSAVVSPMCASAIAFELSHCYAHICIYICNTHIHIYIITYTDTYSYIYTYLHLHTCSNVFKPCAVFLVTSCITAHLFPEANSLWPNLHCSLMSDVLQCMRICCLKML